MKHKILQYILPMKNIACSTKTGIKKAPTHDDFVNWINKIRSDQSFYNQGLAISQKLITQFEKHTIRKQLINLYKELWKAHNRSVIKKALLRSDIRSTAVTRSV